MNDGEGKYQSCNMLEFILVAVCVTLTGGNYVTDFDRYLYGVSPVFKVYQPLYLHEYSGYSSVQIVEFKVPEQTVVAQWDIGCIQTNPQCPEKDVHIYFQHSTYPLVNPKNESFPENFYLERNDLHHLMVNSNNSNITSYDIQRPLQGSWFGLVFLKATEDQLKEKKPDVTCDYLFAVNTSTESLESDQISVFPYTGDKLFLRVQIFQNTKLRMYRFHVSEKTWVYSVVITNCTTKDKVYHKCPVILSTRGGGLPTVTSQDTHRINCSEVPHKRCHLQVFGPKVKQWHYIFMETEISEELDFEMSLSHQECLTLAATPWIKLEHKDTLKSPQNTTLSLVDNNDTNVQLKEDQCYAMSNLFRTMDVVDDFMVAFTIRPAIVENVANIAIVPSKFTRVFAFEVEPISDTGGTLIFEAALVIAPHNFTDLPDIVNISLCLQKGKIPVNGSALLCPEENKFQLSYLVNQSLDVTGAIQMMYPYPETGVWFLAMKAECFTSDMSGNKSHEDTTDCGMLPVDVRFDLRILPCIGGSCGRFGNCEERLKGIYIISTCQCFAKYGGFGCTDESKAKSLKTQLSYTLLLSMSNLFFIPTIILALHRRYFAEAVVYFANMFFSSFYHACDVKGWSIYSLCILPYHVLSYSDFFCSVMSFWVTLIMMAELPPKLLSTIHMLGVIVVAVGVKWDQFGLWPIGMNAFGGLILLISWFVSSRKQKKCYPGKRPMLLIVPGLLLAVTGIMIFNVVETNDNYPYTHSAWHSCMSLCVLFLMPKRQKTVKSTKSQNFEDDVALLDPTAEISGTLNLLPHSTPNGTAGDDPLLDISMPNTYSSSPTEDDMLLL